MYAQWLITGSPEGHRALAGHGSALDGSLYPGILLDMAATAVPFTGDGRDAAEILRPCPGKV